MNKSKLIKTASAVAVVILIIGIVIFQGNKSRNNEESKKVAADYKDKEEITPAEEEQKEEEKDADLTEEQKEQENEATPTEAVPLENTTPEEEPAKQEKPKETVNNSKPKEVKPAQETPKQSTPEPTTPTPVTPAKEEPKQPSQPSQPPAQSPAPEKQEIYNCAEVIQKLKGMGLGYRSDNGGVTWYSGSDMYSSVGDSINGYDIAYGIFNSSLEHDEVIKKTLEVIIPGSGSRLYSILDNPNLKSQTLNLGGRKVVISMEDYGIKVLFGPIIK